jgi:excisionase family DNA binding protein
MDSPEETPDPDPLDEILTLVEAAELSGISAHTFAQQAEKGKLRARKVGHTWITTRSGLNAYLRLHARHRHEEP